MSLTLEPLNDAADPWLMALDRLKAKILSTDLSFYKYCLTAFGRAPQVFALEPPGPNDMVFDPNPDLCPAVVLDFQNPGVPEDHGAGAERWPLTIGVYFKAMAPNGDKRAAVRAFHELLRTTFRGWRTGTMDPLSTITNGPYSLLPSDLTMEFSRPGGGMTIGRGAFGVRFSFTENILG